MSGIIFPIVSANMDGHDHATNLVSRDLTTARIIRLNGEVDDMMALNITTQLSYLDERDPDADIIMYINSRGGSVSAGMAIYDMMKYGIHCDVCTVATGVAASMGALLLAAGTKGKRYATPNAEIMIHQPILGGVQGQATDISLVADHIQRIKKRLNSTLAEACGKTVQELTHDTDRDNWKTAEEALRYGLIDHVGFPDATAT